MGLFEVFRGPGKITYPYTSGGGGPGGEGGSTSEGPGYDDPVLMPGEPGEQDWSTAGGGGSGVGGHGPVWSDSDQIIWVQAGDSPRYPVLVKPGWNDIGFWIPSIFPDDDWIEGPIIIDAPGYVLFPAGFEWEVVTSGNAPKRFGDQKMVDSIHMSDLFDILLEKAPEPINLDGIIEELDIVDVMDTLIKKVDISYKEFLDSVTFTDVNSVEIDESPFDGDVDSIIEESGLKDVIETLIKPVNIREEVVLENLDIEDSQENESVGISDVIAFDFEKEE